MKLEDIKKAVVDAASAELKRSLYNAAAVMSDEEITALFYHFIGEVYASDAAAETDVDS